MLILKRYKNRKIYNSETATYVTNKEVMQLAISRPVQIIDHNTKEDITAKALLHALIEFGTAKSVTAESIVNFAKTA